MTNKETLQDIKEIPFFIHAFKKSHSWETENFTLLNLLKLAQMSEDSNKSEPYQENDLQTNLAVSKLKLPFGINQ